MAYYAPGTIIPSKLHHILTTSTQSDSFRFLDLPGEIRNTIYDLVFEACLVEVRINRRQQDSKATVNQSSIEPLEQSNRQHNKNLHPHGQGQTKKPAENNVFQAHSKAGLKPAEQTPVFHQEHSCTGRRKCPRAWHQGRRSGKMGPSRMHHKILSPLSPQTEALPAQYRVSPQTEALSAQYRVPFGFLFSCRKVYDEAICLMYKKTVFRFTSTDVITRFLSVTPPSALKAIQGLELSHVTYGEPELTADRKYKLSDDQRWLKTCKEIRKMTDLKRLRLTLQLNDWPSELSLGEEWARPILCLRGNGLDRVDVTLFHSAFSEDRLNEAARNLERAIMSDEGRMAKIAESRKLHEVKTKKTAGVKTWKVLVLKMNNSPATPS